MRRRWRGARARGLAERGRGPPRLRERLVRALGRPGALLRGGFSQERVRRPRELLQGVLEVLQGGGGALLLLLLALAARGGGARGRQRRVLLAPVQLEPPQKGVRRREGLWGARLERLPRELRRLRARAERSEVRRAVLLRRTQSVCE